MLLRTHRGSRPLYAEIIYFDNGSEALTMTGRRCDGDGEEEGGGGRRRKGGGGGPFQSSITLTYSVQRFLDHIVSNYDHSSCYNFPGVDETWKVEDRDFIFENMLVCNAIEGGDSAEMARSWRRRQPSSLKQLCLGVVSANREALWNDSTHTIIPILIERQLKAYIDIKDRFERRMFLKYMRVNMKRVYEFGGNNNRTAIPMNRNKYYTNGYDPYPNIIHKTFGNIIPFLGGNMIGFKDEFYDFYHYDEVIPLRFLDYGCSFVWKYLADKYTIPYVIWRDTAYHYYYQEKLRNKKKLEKKYYPDVCSPSS